MHIDVDFGSRHLDKKQNHRKYRRRQDVAIGLGDGVLNEAVANQASIHENVNRIAIQLLDFRLGNKTVQPHFAKIVWRGHSCPRTVALGGGLVNRYAAASPRRRLRQSEAFQRLHRRERNQLVESFASEHLIDALAMIGHGRRDQQGVCRRVQLEMLLWMRQGVVGYQRRDMRELGRFRPQKFLARRSIEKQVANRDRGAQRQPGLLDAQYLAAVNFENRSGSFLFGASFQMQAGNRRNRGQRLAAKSQRRNAEQVFGVLDFRSRVTLEGQHGIVAHHATAVVGDLDQLFATGFYLNANARGTRVQRVLQQFFHHRRGTLDHLAGGDLVGDSLGKDVDLAHGNQWSVDGGQWPV